MVVEYGCVAIAAAFIWLRRDRQTKQRCAPSD
jgi:hypothetical protein